MRNEYCPDDNVRRRLTTRQITSYRTWLHVQKQKERPALCFGMYWWSARIATAIQRTGIVDHAGNRRERPDQCTVNNWRVWKRSHKQKGVTFEAYMSLRNEGVKLTVSTTKKDRHPSTDPASIWYSFRQYQGRGGKLSYQEYLARRERRIVAAKTEEARRRASKKVTFQPAVAGDQGLRMEPKSVIAKIERKLLAMGITRLT